MKRATLFVLAAVLAGNASAGPERVLMSDGTVQQQELRIARAPRLAATDASLDPYLKYPPISLPAGPASYHGGPALSVLVARLDRRRGQQIFLGSIQASAGLYGFDGINGAAVPGFAPAQPLAGGTTYSVGLQVENTAGPYVDRDLAQPRYDILAGHRGGTMRRFDAQGGVVWTQTAANYIDTPGSSFGLIDAAGLNHPMFVIDEESFNVYGRSSRTGTVAWTSFDGVSQETHTAAVVGSGSDVSFVTATGTGNDQCEIQRYRVSDGMQLWKQRFRCHTDTYLAVGDIDGQPGDEIAAVVTDTVYPFPPVLVVLNADNGNLLWTFPLGDDSFYGTAPALANLDGQPGLEIVVQTESTLHAVKYAHGDLPGWPVQLCAPNACWMGSSAPVIGDLDGDPAMEIAVTTQVAGSSQNGYLHVFDQSGQRKLLADAVPMPIGSGRASAIADVDGDGHNELIVGGNAWSGTSGNYPSLWVLDFSKGQAVRHGRVAWGQFGADAQHTCHSPAGN